MTLIYIYSDLISMNMSLNTIMCEHPTPDGKGLIVEPLDVVCVRADCQNPNRYACNECRIEHQHSDQFVTIPKIRQFLQNQKCKIQEEVNKTNKNFNSTQKALNDLIKKLENLKQQIQLQQANSYAQLYKLIEANEICNTKQQVQKLGSIMRKIIIYKQGQLEFLPIPVEDKFGKQKLKSDIQKCVHEFLQQIESFELLPVQQKQGQVAMPIRPNQMIQFRPESSQIQILRKNNGELNKKIAQYKLNVQDKQNYSKLIKANRNEMAKLQAKLSKELFGIIEVCFLVDSTGSMETYIEQARKCVNGTIASIKKLTNRDCKLACVAYQDFEELKALKGKYRQIDFTDDPSKLQDFMSPAKLDCFGGGDCAEDIKGGMEQAFKLSWNLRFRIIILITDSPSHGRNYHEGYVDDFQDVKLDDTLLKFKQKNTFLIGLQLNKRTGQMFQVFKDIFKSNEAEELYMTEDLTKIKTEQLGNKIVALISKAAENATQTNQCGTMTKNRQQNKDCGKGGATEALCKTLSDPTNFDKQPGISLTPCKFNIYKVSLRKENFEQKKERVWDIDVDIDFVEEKESNSWDCIRTTNIFAEGQMKAVYLMKKPIQTSEVYVIKQPLGGKTFKSLREAKMECRSHLISKAFLSSFIDELRQAKEEKASPIFIPNVEYSNFIILSDRPDSFWIAERFQKGEFVKYNNNFGWICEAYDDQNQLAQAFSYYTYFSSDFTSIVNDIQGVGQIWTDPVLNTVQGNLDDTDMGKEGIGMFMVSFQHKLKIGKKYLDLLDIDSDFGQ